MPFLFQLIVLLVVLGLVYWLLMSLPLPPPFKIVIQVVVTLIAIGWLLSLVGWWPGGGHGLPLR